MHIAEEPGSELITAVAVSAVDGEDLAQSQQGIAQPKLFLATSPTIIITGANGRLPFQLHPDLVEELDCLRLGLVVLRIVVRIAWVVVRFTKRLAEMPILTDERAYVTELR